MKTNIGDINNRYSQDLKAKRWENFKENMFLAFLAVTFATMVGLILSFIYIR